MLEQLFKVCDINNMKTLRQMFTDKAIQLKLQSEDYIHKTVDQMSNLNKEKKDEVTKQIVWFLRMKDIKQLQVKIYICHQK